MKNYNEKISALKREIRCTKIDRSIDDLSGIISERYRERIIQIERENKVILDEIKLATKGKEIILEQCSMNSF